MVKNFNEYEKLVRSLSEQTYKKYKIIINEDDLERSVKGYHLDHIVSIKECFENNIDPHIAASFHNLRMMYSKENLRKYNKSDMSTEELVNKYYG